MFVDEANWYMYAWARSTFLQEDESFDNTARDRRSEYLQIICLYTYRGNMYHYIRSLA